MASVSLVGVSKVFPGGVIAVDNLDLEVRDEEFLVLLGPSGCGKSTTLRLIAGLEEVTGGEIQIGKEVVNQVPPKDRNIAMVFQNYALYPHMTVYKNMAFGLELRYGGNRLHRIWQRLTNPAAAAALAAKRRGIREQVRQTAQVLGIEKLLDRMPRQLSGGERQRVALGRAIVRQPAVFLFDEPLSNLDARLRLETRRELKELHQRMRSTMIYVTHDQTEAMTLGDRVVVMDHGHIRQIGTPTEVYDRPDDRFVAGFVGSPPMNFVTGRVQPEGADLAFVSAGLRVMLPQRWQPALASLVDAEVVLGVRPEDVTVTALDVAATQDAGRVVLVEPLGDCSLVHVAIAGSDGETNNYQMHLTSKTTPRVPFQRGDHVRLQVDRGRLHVFDAQSGANLVSDSDHAWQPTGLRSET